MAYEVKVTRQCQTTIPSAIRKKYGIDEGDSVVYVDLDDHVAMLLVPKHPIKELLGLQIDTKESIHEMRVEALETAQRLEVVSSLFGERAFCSIMKTIDFGFFSLTRCLKSSQLLTLM